jgi:hypothetical protein
MKIDFRYLDPDSVGFMIPAPGRGRQNDHKKVKVRKIVVFFSAGYSFWKVGGFYCSLGLWMPKKKYCEIFLF